MRLPFTRSACAAGMLAALLGLATVPAAAGVDPQALRAECEYGITLAMMGHGARAESVFVSLLSHAPGDPRANLGNVHVMRGELEVALGFYDWALRRDSTDAGIRLNRATALLLMGEEERAREEATIGVRQAGGARAAATLLGLRPEGPAAATVGKAAEKAFVSKEEIRALLNAAAAGVPADSSRGAGRGGGSTGGERKKPPTWRSGGARAGAESEVAAILYWKR
jgi:tetratricopeptide (TPR) repeat protein